MSLALQRAVDAGFIPMIPPTLVRPEVMRGTGFLGQHADEVYKLEADDLYLVGTSEVPLAGYHMGEILDLASGAKRYAGWSTCYRREAGRTARTPAASSACTSSTSSRCSSTRRPRMPRRSTCASSRCRSRCCRTSASATASSTSRRATSARAARKYDVEAWVPTQGAYRELTSTSNCTTYQARRLDVRYRPAPGAKTAPVATLNGTLATTRWIVALLETHQRPTGRS
jgi:seryl-tRNA synthetase